MQKIMVVDDDSDILFVVARMLEHNGFTVMQVSDCKTAIPIALERKPDLIIFDINLGLCDGRRLCLQLKTIHKFTAPIILFSANKELATNLVVFRADGFIEKPFDGDELVNTVQLQLSIV